MKSLPPPFTTFALAVAVLAALAVVAVQAAPEEDEGAPHAGWLTGTTEERFATLERQLGGLDRAMAEIGYRYGELVVAARERNWDYAAYQTEKMGLTLELALIRRPKRAASAKTFLGEALPAVISAVRAKDPMALDGAMEALQAGCVQCHREEQVLYFKPAVERIHARALREALVGTGPR